MVQANERLTDLLVVQIYGMIHTNDGVHSSFGGWTCSEQFSEPAKYENGHMFCGCYADV